MKTKSERREKALEQVERRIKEARERKKARAHKEAEEWKEKLTKALYERHILTKRLGRTQ